MVGLVSLFLRVFNLLALLDVFLVGQLLMLDLGDLADVISRFLEPVALD